MVHLEVAEDVVNLVLVEDVVYLEVVEDVVHLEVVEGVIHLSLNHIVYGSVTFHRRFSNSKSCVYLLH